ncbi:MAG: zf-HC2 domain-containing protein [Gemmatimonadota bacterium]|nr:zf-HC2 domain-containing protein [Gemmatimonadota bacterium]
MSDSPAMRCKEFIESYTEYCDGRLAPEERERFDAHVEACDSCRRYRSVLERGLALWRALPPASASEDFLPRLRHRLYHLDDAGKLSPRRHLGSAALVAVASVGFLALSWLSFATNMSVEVELPAVAVEAPPGVTEDREPSLFEDGPHLRSNMVLVPAPAALDGADGGLFATYWTYADPIRPQAARLEGQLDEGR